MMLSLIHWRALSSVHPGILYYIELTDWYTRIAKLPMLLMQHIQISVSLVVAFDCKKPAADHGREHSELYTEY